MLNPMPPITAPVAYGPPEPFDRAQRLARDVNRQLLRSISRASPGHRLHSGRTGLLQTADACVAKGEAVKLAVADLPFLLTDFSFGDQAFWSRVAHRQPLTSLRNIQDLSIELSGRESLAKNTLLAAWITCNHAAAFAPLAFGIRRDTAKAIESLELEYLEFVAVHQAARVRPRWESNDRFWLLVAKAINRGDRQSADLVVGYGLRLLAAEKVHTARVAIYAPPTNDPKGLNGAPAPAQIARL